MESRIEILHGYYVSVRCMTEREWVRFSAGYDDERLEEMTAMEFPDYIEWARAKREQGKDEPHKLVII